MFAFPNVIVVSLATENVLELTRRDFEDRVFQNPVKSLGSKDII